jgi:cell division protein FtsA
MSHIIVGLDIGTSKVSALVASLEGNDNVNILGLGKSPSSGLLRGSVVNIETTSRSIREVINLVENQSGEKVHSVIVGIAGNEVQGFTSKSMITTRAPSHEIKKEDIKRLIDDAQRVRLPSDRVILHVLPQEFIVDGIEGIKDPVGMTGIKVEAIVHIVTAHITPIDNIRRSVNRAGLEVETIAFEPLASSYSVLSEEEKEIGVALIDIGAGTTDVAVFEDGIVKYTGSLPIAGNQITDDIRKAFGIQREEAERLKITEGYAYQNSIVEDKKIIVQGLGGRKPLELSRSILCNVIQPRVEEIFELLYKEHLKKSGYIKSLSAGIVLTGGSALLKGIVELAMDKFEMPVRIGIPTGFSGGLVQEVQNPIYATVAGLVLYKVEEIRKGYLSSDGGFREPLKRVWEFLKSIFR